jgi:site-specific recombinase XerD
MTIDEAIERFCQDLAVRHARRTVLTYRTAVRTHFRAYLCEVLDEAPDTAPVTALTVDHVLGLVRWMHVVCPVSPTTMDTYLTALTRFYRWLMLETEAEISATDHARLMERLADIRGRRPSRPLPRVPAEEALQTLLEAAYAVPLPEEPHTADGQRATLRRLRDIAMLEALRTSGARVGELVKLRLGDLDRRQQAAIVRGKGNKERVVYFDDRAWGAIHHYLRARRASGGGRPLESLPVFAQHARRSGDQILPISTDTVRRVFNDLARAADLDVSITPHLLRHRFATRVLQATHDLAATQDLLGHASPTTTRIYAKLTDKDTRAAHRAAREEGL